MGGAFEIIQFAVDATAQLGTLALALVSWRQAHAAPPAAAPPPDELPDAAPPPAGPGTPAIDVSTLVIERDGLKDTLFVYYAGHGMLDIHEDELYLTLPQSIQGRTERALSYRCCAVLQEQRDSVQRRVMVLDCCYSGQVLEHMSAAQLLDRKRIGIEGSYVLTSTAEDTRAVAGRGEHFTAFTGELVKVLRDGIPGRPAGELLTFNQLYDRVRHELAERDLPLPQRQERNGVGNLPFVRNQHGAARTEARPAPAGPLRRRVAAGTAVAVLATGLGVGGTLWWQDAHATGELPAEAAGSCGDNASLLGVSERLDNTVHPDITIKGEAPAGLSALALTSKGKAYALSDSTPARVFEVPLGVPGARLSVGAPTDALSLRHADGTVYESGMDGGGLVVEKGGRTLLVSSESGCLLPCAMAGGARLRARPAFEDEEPWRRSP